MHLLICTLYRIDVIKIYMSVQPQVLIGNPQTAQQGDSLAQFYNKYNAHTHDDAATTNFLLLGIKPGYLVSALDANLNAALAVGTVVDAVSIDRLIFNFAPSYNTNLDLVFADPLDFTNSVIVKNVSLSILNNYILNTQLSSSNGNITATQAGYINNLLLIGNLPFIAQPNLIHTVLFSNLDLGYLTKLYLNCQLGDINLSLLINNTIIKTYVLTSGEVMRDLSLDLNTATVSSKVEVNSSVRFKVNSYTNTPFVNYNLNLLRV